MKNIQSLSQNEFHKVLHSILACQIEKRQLQVDKDEFQRALEEMKGDKIVEQSIKKMIVQNGNDVQRVQQSIARFYRMGKQEEENAEVKKEMKEQLERINIVRGIFRKSLGSLKDIVSKPWKKLMRKNEGSKNKSIRNRKTEVVRPHYLDQRK